MIFKFKGRPINIKVKRTGEIEMHDTREKIYSLIIGTIEKCKLGYYLYTNENLNLRRFYGTKDFAIHSAIEFYETNKEAKKKAAEKEAKEFKEKIDNFLTRLKGYTSKFLTEKTIKEIDAIIKGEDIETFVCLELYNGVGNREPSISIHFGFDGRERRIALGSIGFVPRNFDDIEKLNISNQKLLNVARTSQCLLDTIF